MKVLLLTTILLGLLNDAFCADCKWSGCEGLMISGQSICNDYKLGTYTGYVKKTGCKWDTTKVQCCKPTNDVCKWSTHCYGSGYSGSFACDMEFGYDWVPNGEAKKDNCSFSLQRHQCCN